MLTRLSQTSSLLLPPTPSCVRLILASHCSSFHGPSLDIINTTSFFFNFFWRFTPCYPAGWCFPRVLQPDLMYLREVANIWVNNKNFTPSRSFEVFNVVAKNQIRQVSNQINGIKEKFEKFCEFGEKMVHTISTGITLHLDICSFNYWGVQIGVNHSRS